MKAHARYICEFLLQKSRQNISIDMIVVMLSKSDNVGIFSSSFDACIIVMKAKKTVLGFEPRNHKEMNF